MKPLRVMWVGKTQHRFVSEGVEYYRKLLNPICPLEFVEIKNAGHSGREPQEGIRREGAALLKRIDKEDLVILLDEKGKELTTRQWAEDLGRQRGESGRSTCFIIGGAYGVEDSVRQRADHTIALSRLTFPHQLVRIVLMEQLYRMFSLLSGGGYHHD